MDLELVKGLVASGFGRVFSQVIEFDEVDDQKKYPEKEYPDTPRKVDFTKGRHADPKVDKRNLLCEEIPAILLALGEKATQVDEVHEIISVENHSALIFLIFISIRIWSIRLLKESANLFYNKDTECYLD